MLFNTTDYALFFASVFAVSWLLARLPRVRLFFLLLASYFFYARWDARFLVLIFGSSSVDFWLAHRIHASTNERSRKIWLWFTVVLNLGLLGFFKYFNFGADLASSLASQLGFPFAKPALEIALPVGISFFTFESMSYVIDVHRRELEPHKDYFEYLLFVAFFPHLVAGPIVRPRDLLPQLAGLPRFSASAASEGLFLVAVGLAKKIVIGDYLALNLVDRVFDAPLQYSALETYAGCVGYALQIYCDFSGYTDIAIGSALLLGVRFPKNFDSPYKSRSITEFWRRWHISLSTWLRDYLYISLGGNRQGKLRTYANLLVTMMLGGLWHGASLTFLLWGTVHGLLLAFERARKEFGLDWESFSKKHNIPKAVAIPVGVFVTFHLVLATWVLFRAESFAKAELVFRRLGTLTTHHANLPSRLLAVLALGLVTHFIPARWFEALKERFVTLHALPKALALVALLIVLRRLASTESVPFVGVQF